MFKVNLSGFGKELFHKGLRDETRKQYIGITRDFLVHYGEASLENAEAFLGTKADVNCSGVYRNLCYYALQNYFRFLNKDSKLKLPFSLSRKEEHIQPTFSMEQVNKMLSIAKGNSTDYLILRVLFATGIRRSELASICKGDVVREGDGFFLRIKKPKGRREREVPLDAGTGRALQRLKGKGRLFNVKPQEITRIVNCYALKAGARAPRTGAHALRRAFATSLHDGGGDIFDLQQILGHENLEQTRKYVSVSRKRLDRVFNKAHPWGNKSPTVS